MDDHTDGHSASDLDDRWMSYREHGLARGISRASAARLAHRHRWRRRTDNDGTVRVLVPHGQDTPADRHPVDVQPRMRDHFWRERKKRGLSVSPWQLRLEATAFVVACHRRRVEAQANRGRLN